MLTLNLLDQTVSTFFGRVNWDARPQLQKTAAMAPMQLISVREFFLSIPWSGDPQDLAARSLAASVAHDPMPEIEDSSLTLSDLFECF
ncbi:MAG: hypothetical protein HC818_07070 [Synechococcaceae cyanobacterium RM1_1_27]|nr:hypothetical protein [Synechococcaceae cyanobacterium SM2_3_2]NJO86310.1 hypothetical protein [Synechococcaceae cyanobacterium RM1_1_27]